MNIFFKKSHLLRLGKENDMRVMLGKEVTPLNMKDVSMEIIIDEWCRATSWSSKGKKINRANKNFKIM